jgi:hypothetical protein
MRSKQEIRGIVDGFAKSGMTRREYCEKHKIAITTLDYWRRAQKSKPKLVEVAIEFLLDQVCHPPRRPQTGFIAQRLWPAFQPAFNLLQVFGTQSRLAAGPPGFPQPRQPHGLQLLGPATYRLPMRPDPPRHLGLMNSLLQQPCRPPSAASPVPPAGFPMSQH